MSEESGTADKVLGATGGGIKGGAKSTATWLGITVIGGAVLGALLLSGALSVGVGVAAVTNFLFSWTTIGAVVGGIVGFGVFTGTWPIAAVGGAAVGGYKGVQRAGKHGDEIALQRSSAIDAQIDAMANPAVGYPAQGTPMNPCACTVHAGDCQHDGPLVANNINVARN